ncbi:hypothetical protein [Amycolatopsis sp. cmx-11-12]|uniref:hypothetical protein n=1 Tax=Amycolatopsis sp. cmx-11-12 TaxID=2785795 RepID=UPI00391763B7
MLSPIFNASRRAFTRLGPVSPAVAGYHNATIAAAVRTAITAAAVHIAVRVNSGNHRTDDDVVVL